MLPLLATLVLVAGCADSMSTEGSPMGESMVVTSAAFEEGGQIPRRHSCDGADASPPLAWSGAPAGTAAFALIVDDPDARGFVHWIATDIPAGTTSLAEGESAGVEGRNDFRRNGYGGPCPPSGSHRYVFEVFALSEELGLSSGFSADELRSALEGKVLASGRLSANYRRGS